MWPLLPLQNEVKEPTVEPAQYRCLCSALLICNEKHREIDFFFLCMTPLSTEWDRLINYTEPLWKQTNHICRQTLFASSYKCNWFENTVPNMQLKTTDLLPENDDKIFDESTHLHNLTHRTVNTTERERETLTMCCSFGMVPLYADGFF